MPGTIRDYIIKADQEGYSEDDVKSSFQERFGVPIETFKGKLDTELRAIPKKEQTQAAVSELLPAGFKAGLEPAAPAAPLQKPAAIVAEPTPAAPAPKQKIPEEPRSRLVGAEIGRILGGIAGGAPGSLLGAGLGAAIGAPARRAERIAEERKAEPEGARGEPITEKPEPTAEEPVGLPAEATETKVGVEPKIWQSAKGLTKDELDTLARWDYHKEPDDQEVVDIWKKHAGSTKTPDVFELRHLRQEAIKQKAREETPRAYWPTPTEVMGRLSGMVPGIARSALGETKLSQELEEPRALLPFETYPDPDQPRPPESMFSTRAEMWDALKKDPKLEQEIRQQYKSIYAARAARGAPLHGEGLPAGVDVSTERFAPAVKQVEEERKARRVRGGFIAAPANFIYNLGTDVAQTLGAMEDLVAQVAGPQPLPETPQTQEFKRQVDEATQKGDSEALRKAMFNLKMAQQESIGEHTGEQLGMAPGQMAALFKGLTAVDGTNTALTHPLQVAQLLAPPAIGGLKGARALAEKNPVLDAKLTKVETAVSKAASVTAKRVGEVTGATDKVNAFKQYLTDSFWTGNKRTSQFLEKMLKGDDRGLEGESERLLRIVKQGEAKPEPVPLQEAELYMTPAEDIRTGKAAERAAAKAFTEAETLRTRKAMSQEVVEHVKEIRKQINRLKNEANRVQEQIAGAAEEADVAALKAKLNALNKGQEELAARATAEMQRFKLQGKAKDSAIKAMFAGVGLAEESKKTGAAVSTPLKITRGMKKALIALGKTAEEINNMKPKEAWELLNKEVQKPSKLVTTAKAADRKVMSALAKMELQQAAADEAASRGVTREDVIRERESRIREALAERERKAAGKAAVAGVGLAETAKALPEAEIAETAARRAAAKQAPAVAGAERRAARLAEEAKTAGERPEVYMGKVYLPPEKIVAPELTEQHLVDAVEKANRQTEVSGSELSKRAAQEARKDLDEYRALKQAEEPHRESQYRKNRDFLEKAADQAELAADQADLAFHEEIKEWNAGRSDRRSFEDARIKRESTRAEADAARAKADAAERRHRIVSKSDVPKVPEIRITDVKSREYLNEMRNEAWKRYTEAWEAWTSDPKNAPHEPVKEAADALTRIDNMIKARELAEKPMAEDRGAVLMERRLAEVPEHHRAMIEEEARKASDYKKAALDEGFDPNAPVSDETATKTGVPQGSTIYDAARRFAEHLNDINKGGTMDVPAIVREFLQANGVEKGLDSATKWLDQEAKASGAAAGMIEPAYGAVRRPTPVEEAMELTKEGKLIPRPMAVERGLERTRGVEKGETVAVGEQRQMQEALDSMQEYLTQKEPPKSITTSNEKFNELLDKYVNNAIELGYKLDPREIAKDTDQLQFGDPDSWVKKQSEATVKVLTPKRLKQRVLENLLDDTMQTAMHSEVMQSDLLNMAKKRMKDAGLQKAAVKNGVIEINNLLTDPKRVSAHSKNHFPDIKVDGKAILTRQDFIDAANRLDPSMVQEARANAFNYVTNEVNKAAQSFATFQNMDSELHRFSSKGGDAGYARNLANGVARENQTYPLMMPYEGKKIATYLREIAKNEPEDWTPEELDRINKLANYVEKFDSGKQIQDAANKFHTETFEHTDIKPPPMENVYADPAVNRAMKEHFSSLRGMQDLNAVQKAVLAVVRSTMKSVVALNLRALANNNLSNSMLQITTRGSADFLPKLFSESLNFKRFLEGDTAGMSEAQIAMYEAINKRNALDRTSFEKVYGGNTAYDEFKKTTGMSNLEAAAKAADINWAKPLEMSGKFRDFLADLYTKAGDAPFRLEDMVHEYGLLSDKIGSLENGTSITVPVNKYNKVKVTNLGEGKFEIRDISGQEKPIVVEQGSPKLNDVMAAAADVAQNEKFLGYDRMGLWAKSLRQGLTSVLSGIFGWQYAALDVPFLKKGLFSKMLEGPTAYETTSKAVRAMQTNQYMSLAMKKAIAINALQASALDQRQLEELARSLGNDPSMLGTIVGAASNPGYIRFRNVAPANFTAPTMGAMNALVTAAQALEYSPYSKLSIGDDTRAQIMSFNPKFLSFTDDQMEGLKETNPELYKFATEQRELAKKDPEAYEDMRLLNRDFQRYATGSISSTENFMKTIGLSGSPILRWLMDSQSDKWSPEVTEQKFWQMVFGATPWAIGDVALALAGEAGVEPASRWSTYGTALGKSGETYADASTFGEYAIRTLLGMGWITTYYGTGKEHPSSAHQYGKMKAYLNLFEKSMRQTFLNAAKKQSEKTLHPGASDEALEIKAKESKYYKIMDKALDRVLNDKRKDLREQYRTLHAIQKQKLAPEND